MLGRLALEARQVAAVVAGRERLRQALHAGQQAAAERRVRDQRRAEFAAGRQNLGLDVAREERVLGLQRGDRVHRGRALERRRRDLRQTERADLAGAHQPGHRADRLLDRHSRVDAMRIVEVDDVRFEARERGLAGALDVLGPVVEADAGAVGGAFDPELGREHDLLAASL